MIARICAFLLLNLAAVPASALGATYQVGPGSVYPDLQSVAEQLGPGDLVEVEGGREYPGGVTFAKNGLADAPIVIRGIGARRPVLVGVPNMPGLSLVRFQGSHYIFEGFDLTAHGKPVGTRGIYNVADNIEIRDCSVHDCPFNGIAGSDASGSLRLSRVEVYRCGAGDRMHQIYVGSSNARYPKAVFRMELCYVHDGAGGNNVKSRVTRNEIYSNWIEGAVFHELDLIGADPAGQNGAPDLREDSDVVGNVLLRRPASLGYVANLGGDGTGVSQGRYRFVNNTVWLPEGTAGDREVFRIKQGIESLELHHNVFFRAQKKPVRVLNDSRLPGGTTFAASGENNWISAGTAPRFFHNTRELKPTDLRNAERFDFHPTGALAECVGNDVPSGREGFAFPMPLERPAFAPPNRAPIKGEPVIRGSTITPGAF